MLTESAQNAGSKYLPPKSQMDAKLNARERQQILLHSVPVGAITIGLFQQCSEHGVIVLLFAPSSCIPRVVWPAFREDTVRRNVEANTEDNKKRARRDGNHKTRTPLA